MADTAAANPEDLKPAIWTDQKTHHEGQNATFEIIAHILQTQHPRQRL
jgi:hypothetical protein